MFEAAELGKELSKREYAKELPALREALLTAQQDIIKAGVPVLIIISGVDGAGKAELVHRLNEWLDPRGVDTHAAWQKSDEEEERPRYWRYWRRLPAKGRIGIFFGSWYSQPVIDRAFNRTKNRHLDTEMDRVLFLEQMLARDGALIIKLWFHLPKPVLKASLKAMSRDPKKHWRVLPLGWKHFKRFDDFVIVSERALRHTDSGHAPWHIIEATDRRYREMTSARIIADAIKAGLATQRSKTKSAAIAAAPVLKSPSKKPDTILDVVDLTRTLSEREYGRQLKKYQAELSRLAWHSNKKKMSSVIVFEGWDAGGKGSAIRRVTGAMDPRLYRVIPIGVPTDEERAHHYLWRFWRHLPRAGKHVIFDRSWYGRVLVERVEGFAAPDEWQRSFFEINDFEEQLVENDILVTKFWLHISREEQLQRFNARKADATKLHKITDEDWRNRDKWDAYKMAVNDMVQHTSTGPAPWTLIAGNDKRSARIQILKTICENFERRL